VSVQQGSCPPRLDNPPVRVRMVQVLFYIVTHTSFLPRTLRFMAVGGFRPGHNMCYLKDFNKHHQ